jgi:hypothetical protein
MAAQRIIMDARVKPAHNAARKDGPHARQTATVKTQNAPVKRCALRPPDFKAALVAFAVRGCGQIPR